jgi:type II secretory pathway component PulC
MITTLLALSLLQEAAPDNVYERLKKQNLFSPKLEKPPPPPPKREEKREEKKEEPPPPRKYPFEVAGIVFINATQSYEALIMDREWDDATFLKPGDALHGAKVEAIAADQVTVSINGESRPYRVGAHWEMFVEGRKGGGRVREEKSEEKKEEKKEEVAETKPASGDRPKREVSGGLLERWRKMKKENP